MSKDAVVLVVDDEREHADGMAEALQKSCAKAIGVYNGTDALEIIRTQDIDVIVTDLKLGGDIDGLAILREARKLGRSEVILITAYATIDTCKEAIREGAFDYIVKPINIDQLRTLVEQAARRAIRELEGHDDPCLADYARSDSPQHAAMVDRIRQRLGLTTLKYQKLDDLVEAIGLPKEKLCTYCWDGVDNRDESMACRAAGVHTPACAGR